MFSSLLHLNLLNVSHIGEYGQKQHGSNIWNHQKRILNHKGRKVQMEVTSILLLHGLIVKLIRDSAKMTSLSTSIGTTSSTQLVPGTDSKDQPTSQPGECYRSHKLINMANDVNASGQNNDSSGNFFYPFCVFIKLKQPEIASTPFYEKSWAHPYIDLITTCKQCCRKIMFSRPHVCRHSVGS